MLLDEHGNLRCFFSDDRLCNNKYLLCVRKRPTREGSGLFCYLWAIGLLVYITDYDDIGNYFSIDYYPVRLYKYIFQDYLPENEEVFIDFLKGYE